MDNFRDDRLKQIIKTGLDQIKPDVQAENRCLREIHKKIEMRNGIMKFNKKRMVAALAAVCTITVMGTVTAIAGGKITGLFSSVSRDDMVHSKVELVQLAENQMGTAPKLVDTFSNGISFNEGSITKIEGRDENQNSLISFPELYAGYGKNNRVALDIHEHQDLIPQGSSAVIKQDVYQDITLKACEDNYLFLPPDANPSAEDSKLEEDGKLMISYGSDKEERKIFRYVNWSENGMEYSLSSFDDLSCDDLIGMAKEVIDVK
ncbi:MAG TPA: hypothetical protein DDW53_07645 [Lachnoclostridium sp.]|uniref:hypothetical protein n=1 Tax=Lacrimispora celerecrescens TaxID=29354 RepID=UPI000E9F655A|nr:hypothetical protein [Lacrimispora celerecrescens]HBE85331.1 hypothetical protein [Lachnoclostridium sp.]